MIAMGFVVSVPESSPEMGVYGQNAGRVREGGEQIDRQSG